MELRQRPEVFDGSRRILASVVVFSGHMLPARSFPWHWDEIWADFAVETPIDPLDRTWRELTLGDRWSVLSTLCCAVRVQAIAGEQLLWTK